MPGINLSQSAVVAEHSEQRMSASSKAVYVSLFLLFVSVIAYGVLWYFSSNLDKKQAVIMQNIQNTRASYTSAAAFRVAKLFIKGEAIMNERSFPDVNPADELQVINKHILSDVVLDSYENDLSTNTVKISGQTTAFLRVAQQMKTLYDSGNFSDVVLASPVIRDDKGRITFSLSLTRAVDQKKN